MISRKFLYILMVPIFIMAFATSSCDSGGDGESSGSIQKEEVTIQGALSEVVVASADSKNESKFIAFFENIITKIAHAQTTTVLEGILVEAYDDAVDSDNPVASDTTDTNGEFTLLEVPCDTPLRLVFTHEDVSVSLAEGVIAPCPDGSETGVLTMTFSIDFIEEDGSNDDVDEQEEVNNAQISCLGGEQQTMVENELVIDGEEGACVIAAGNCNLEIIAASVKMINCSTCIDTRGNSDVEIKTTEYECDASEDGIRSVGSSEVEIEVFALAEMMDDTPIPSDMEPLLQLLKDDSVIGSGSGNILISAGEDGVDLRGNTKIELMAAVFEEDEDGDDDDDNNDDGEDDGDSDDDDDDNNDEGSDDGTDDGNEDGDDDDDDDNNELPIFTKNGEGGNVIIEGGDNGIIAVGNSEMEVRGFDCDIIPGTTSKGNAEIDIDCGLPSEDFDE